ncbi:MAG: hypothetical protein JXL67_13365 [Calditrichaeota bacterium]|nr:hypothetical protein [Calditrichota bacterium]
MAKKKTRFPKDLIKPFWQGEDLNFAPLDYLEPKYLFISPPGYSEMKIILLDIFWQVYDDKRISISDLPHFTDHAEFFTFLIPDSSSDKGTDYPFSVEDLRKMLPKFRKLDLKASYKLYSRKLEKLFAAQKQRYEMPDKRLNGEQILNDFLLKRAINFKNLSTDVKEDIRDFLERIREKIKDLYRFGYFREEYVSEELFNLRTIHLVMEYYEDLETDEVIQIDRTHKRLLRDDYKDLEKLFFNFYERLRSIGLSPSTEATLIVPGLKLIANLKYLKEQLAKEESIRRGRSSKFFQNNFIYYLYQTLGTDEKVKEVLIHKAFKGLEQEKRDELSQDEIAKRIYDEAELELRNWIADLIRILGTFIIYIYDLVNMEFPFNQDEYDHIGPENILDTLQNLNEYYNAEFPFLKERNKLMDPKNLPDIIQNLEENYDGEFKNSPVNYFRERTFLNKSPIWEEPDTKKQE